jgi:hypothetical protein
MSFEQSEKPLKPDREEKSSFLRDKVNQMLTGNFESFYQTILATAKQNAAFGTPEKA